METSFAGLVWEFVVQMLSGVVAVFVGIWLALVVERRRRAEDANEHAATAMRDFDRAVDTVLGSVVKNTAEARRIVRMLKSTRPAAQCVLQADLDTSVWYASQSQFTTLCSSVDERVIFAQFFDGVRRLQSFVDFRCQAQVLAATTGTGADAARLHALEDAIDRHLASLAEDLRMSGVLLVTDHGKPVHKRLMGIHVDEPAAPHAVPLAGL